MELKNWTIHNEIECRKNNTKWKTLLWDKDIVYKVGKMLERDGNVFKCSI